MPVNELHQSHYLGERLFDSSQKLLTCFADRINSAGGFGHWLEGHEFFAKLVSRAATIKPWLQNAPARDVFSRRIAS